MKTLYSLVAVLLLAIAAQAGNNFPIPEQKLVGVEQTIELGELVVVGVSPIVQKPQNYASTSYTWKLKDAGFKDKTFQTSTDGSQIFFGAGIKPKTLWVECVATHLYLVKDSTGSVKEAGTETVILEGQVNIGGGEPQPAPDPSPAPVFPDGAYQLSKFSYDQAMGSVPAANRAKAAAVLAASYRGIASAAAAGTIKTPAQLLNQTKQANGAALQQAGVSAAEWATFSSLLQDRLYGLYQSKKINTVADFATAWNEIAAGLEKVK